MIKDKEEITGLREEREEEPLVEQADMQGILSDPQIIGGNDEMTKRKLGIPVSLVTIVATQAI